MTIFAEDLVQRKELAMRASARMAWAVSSDTFLSDDASQAFRQRGFSRYIKTADPTTFSTDSAVNLATLDAAFLAEVDRQSLLGALDAAGAVRIPLNGAARLQVGSVVAEEVAEAATKPVMRLDFTTAGTPTKVEATILWTAEVLRAIDPQTQAGVTNVLTSATAAATDVKLIQVLTAAAGSPIGSSTVAELFAAITGGAPRRPVLIGGLDSVLALPAGTVRDLQALGIVVLTTPAAAGYLLALDASGLLISEDAVNVQTARHATLDLNTSSPNSAPVSL